MAFAARSEKVGDVTLFALSGQLDSRTAPELEREIAKSLGKDGRSVLFDLTELEFVASAGLRIVIMVGKRLTSDGGVIALCGLNPSVREVFEIAGFAKLFPILANRAEALANLAARSKSAGIGRLADRILHQRGEPAGPLRLAPASAADPERVALAARILLRGPAPKRGK